jgi:integral membrane sensor domain MASE1
LALAFCLLWGNRVWPAIAIGAFLANAITFGSIITSIAIALGNTLEGMVTASLVSKWCTKDKPFGTPARAVIYSSVTFAPGTVISATVGVGSLVLAGYADPSKFGDIWFTWWLGDVGGQLVVAPVIILWANANIFALDRNELVRMAWLMAATITVGLVAFSPLISRRRDAGYSRSSRSFHYCGPRCDTGNAIPPRWHLCFPFLPVGEIWQTTDPLQGQT